MAQKVDETAKDGKQAKDKDGKQAKDKDGKADTPKEDEPEELSEEDQALKDELEQYVQTLSGGSAAAAKQQSAVEAIGKAIREATTSMTSVPKPLKFLRPHYGALKDAHTGAASAAQAALADVVSVLATVAAEEGSRDALTFRLRGAGGDPATWGHEYVGHLAGELAAEHDARSEAGEAVDDLMALVQMIVPYHMAHNSEPEAVDLLLEVDAIGALLPHVTAANYARTCLYLTSAAAYLPEPDDAAALGAAYDAYLQVERWHDAMRVALRLNDRARIERSFAACTDGIDKQQLAYLLARQGVVLDCEEGPCAIEDEGLREKVVAVLANERLTERYAALARDLDVAEAKLPADVYKQHLVDTRRGAGAAALESGMRNLSDSLVNALLNAGFGADKLVTVDAKEGDKTWIARNKNQGKTAAVASLGMIHMWNTDAGLPVIDPYTYSAEPAVVAGACLGIGLSCCCIRSEIDPAFALLCEHVASGKPAVRCAAVQALGLAYAGSGKADVRELLLLLVDAEEASPELAGHLALALGLTYAASADEEVAEALLHYLMLLPEEKLTEGGVRFVVLGLAFLFLGTQTAAAGTIEVARSLNERIALFAATLLDAAAYAGTGNVLKVQELLALCGEHGVADEAAPWKTAHLTAAALGVGLVAMGEPLGADMAARMLEHLLSYADASVRAAVPLALALLRPSAPDMAALATLSRLSHDPDTAVARAAVIALGVSGAGTNNARLAGMLRQLSSYYGKDGAGLHCVRVAQGLLHMGKGLLTLAPYHSDRQLLSPIALASLLTLLLTATDSAAALCGTQAPMLFYIAPALRPRMLLTLDEDGAVTPASVRVGAAVDTVAQAGKPKAITGFQTHDTPVLLAAEDRAELADDKFVPATPLLEGFVILKKNPDYVPSTADK